MTTPQSSTPRRRAWAWWVVSLGVAVVGAVVLTWGVGALDRWGALPAPQAPAWYDCNAAGQRFALQYRQGSDRVGLQWSDGTSLQGDTYPDRMEWRHATALEPQRAAVLPRAFRYESAQRLELLTASQIAVECQRRTAKSSASTP